MTPRAFMTVGLFCASFWLTGCSEQPQAMGGIKSDAAPHEGVGASQYAQPGWKAGDRTAWEQQLKARTAYGQNDYTRMTN